MLRVLGKSSLAIGWRQCALYVVAMSTISVAAMCAGYVVSESIWKAAVDNASDQPRALSRVEKYFAAKANAEMRAEPGPYRPVVALVRPDIHPAALAAALDRTELASALEYPEHHPVETVDAAPVNAEPVAQIYDIASWRLPAVQVAGITCTQSECHDSAQPSVVTDEHEPVEVAAAEINATEINATDIVFATSSADGETFATEPLVKPLTKYRVGKGRANARQKPSRKVLTQYADEPGIVKFFVGPGATSLRVAETPGDIIRRTLRGTI